MQSQFFFQDFYAFPGSRRDGGMLDQPDPKIIPIVGPVQVRYADPDRAGQDDYRDRDDFGCPCAWNADRGPGDPEVVEYRFGKNSERK